MTSRHDWKTSISSSISELTDKRMEDMTQNGIHHIELKGGHPEAFDELKKNSKQFTKRWSDAGIIPWSMHLPYSLGRLDPAGLEASVRDSFVGLQSDFLKMAGEIGIKIAVVHPSGEPYREDEREERLKCAVDSLWRLNEVAKAEGIKLGIENLPRTCICRDCNEIIRVGKEIPDAYFTFDSNHSLIDPNSQIIKAMGNRIVALHISDCDFTDEQHMFPGNGENNWAEVMTCLEQADYSGTWNYEIWGSDGFPGRRFRENREWLLGL